jgi:ubiquinone/menaquinone biosynthesis C-methylase UbiE
MSGRFYFEDYVRVYPDHIVLNCFGVRRQATTNDVNNYLNHRKFYEFVGQFVKDKQIADVGCGSGYGCEILHQRGAKRVYGCDISRHAIRFARKKYGNLAEFCEQGITDLHNYNDNYFDITISSEVLEHIKEYHMEEKAIKELKRITRQEGLIVVGTPNSEMLDEHGFSFDEINSLFTENFERYCIFENALIPFGNKRLQWEERRSEGKLGIIVTENINFFETVLPENVSPEKKVGITPGQLNFSGLCIDTTLLHNTHSWVVVAKK